MRKTTTILAVILAACSSGGGRGNPLDALTGRMYTNGSDSTGDHIALRVDQEPIDGETLSGTLFIDDGREFGARLYRDPNFDGFLVIEYSGFPWAVWSWVEVLEGGARLGPGIEGLGYFPEAPGLGLVPVNYMSVQFWE